MSTWLGTGRSVVDVLLREDYGPGKLGLFIGPAGSGKTILGMHYLLEGIEKNENVLRVTAGNEITPLKTAYRLQVSIQSMLNDKRLLEECFPVEFSNSLKLKRLKRLIRSAKISRVLVDSSISYFNTKNIKGLLALLKMLKESGVQTILIQRGPTNPEKLEEYYLPVDPGNITYLGKIDYLEERLRYIFMVKNTSAERDYLPYELTIGPYGINVLSRLYNFKELLAGVPYGDSKVFKDLKKPNAVLVRKDGLHSDRLVEKLKRENKGLRVSVHLTTNKHRVNSVDDFRHISPDAGLVYVNSAFIPQLKEEKLLSGISEVLPDIIRNECLKRSYQPFLINGTLYGFAKNMELTLLFYRKDLLRKHGIKPPEDWNELIGTAKRILKLENNPALDGITFPSPLANPYNITTNILFQLLRSSGLDLYSESAYFGRDEHKLKAALVFIGDCINRHKLASEKIIDKAFEWYGMNTFVAGNSIFLLSSSDMFLTLSQERSIINFHEHIGYIIMPPAKKGNTVNVIQQAAVYVVPRVIKDKKTAMRQLKCIINETTAEDALDEYPFPPKGAFYRDKKVLKSRSYYSGMDDIIEGAEMQEQMWKQDKINPVLFEEHRQYLIRKRTPEEFIKSLREEITAVVGALDEYNPYVISAIKFIETNYMKKLSRSLIAKEAGASVRNLQRLFRKDTHYSIIEYLENLRVHKAKEYILSGNGNVSEMAYKEGYSDPFYFSNVFKKKTGITPSLYK